MGLSNSSSKCIFCEITKGETDSKDGKTRILAESERFILFCDIKPASKHHYLAVPKLHITNPKVLSTEADILLIKEMYKFAQDYCISIGVDCHNDALFGFHWPPLVSVQHLHLHIISPASEMSYFHSTLYKKDSRYFIHPDALIQWITKKYSLQ